MASKFHLISQVMRCIICLVTLSHLLSCNYVNGNWISRQESIPSTVEDIDGNVFDCVDIHKQPAFSHPLLKNHTLQLKPSSYPRGFRSRKSIPFTFQRWGKSGGCPQGTIPIENSRARAIPYARKIAPPNHGAKLDIDPSHEYAQVSVADGKYYGANAAISVWHPATERGEFSVAQIWLLSGHGDYMNTIEAGWKVHGGDDRTRFFIYWTRDNYRNTGCYNLQCPGFVQTNHKVGLGGAINPISTFSGSQFHITLHIHKDKKSGNWWLTAQDQVVGYWPGSIFTVLAESSSSINWGGEIFNSRSNGHHTSTQMGSGHFPGLGFGKSSFFTNIAYVDDSGALRDADNLVPFVSKPSCYDLQVEKKVPKFGVFFYYGGPGYSSNCQ